MIDLSYTKEKNNFKKFERKRIIKICLKNKIYKYKLHTYTIEI